MSGREKEREEVIGEDDAAMEVLETVEKIEMRDGEAEQREGAFFFFLLWEYVVFGYGAGQGDASYGFFC